MIITDSKSANKKAIRQKGGVAKMNQNTVDTLKIKSLMALKGETQEELADTLGISRSTLNRKLTGKINFTLADLEQLAKHFGVRVAELISG